MANKARTLLRQLGRMQAIEGKLGLPRDYPEILARVRRRLQSNFSEPELLVRGWEHYARKWQRDTIPPQILRPKDTLHLGDEWSREKDIDLGVNAYDLPEDVLVNFERYIKEQLLDPYLPPYALEGLEIGPGAGRMTALLVPKTKVLHVAEPSKTMLRLLQQRFAGVSTLRYYQTDGMTLPTLRSASLDYFFAFDVFVHFEPRLIYWYLRQVSGLLRPGGVGIIHYSNILTRVGWVLFERALAGDVNRRTDFASFGVMCPQLMQKFLEVLELEVVSADLRLIPRDAIAVFRRPAS